MVRLSGPRLCRAVTAVMYQNLLQGDRI